VTRGTTRYEESLSSTASHVREMLPVDIGDLFARISRNVSINSVSAKRDATVAAIDGSNAVVLESGSLTASAIRAGGVLLRDGEIERKRTPLLLISSGSGDERDEFSDLYHECFGGKPEKSLEGDEKTMLASLARDTLEYWIAGQVLGSLKEGDLLLLDGSLRVSHGSHDRVLMSLVAEAEQKGVLVVAVAKRTAATFGKGHPLLPAVAAYAGMHDAIAPWWIKIDYRILDQTRFTQWQHGEVYTVSLHPSRAVPLKIELPARQSSERADRAISLLAGCSDDGRIPGYPFPLLEAHRTVTINEAMLVQVKQDMISALDRVGFDLTWFDTMFGDYHDEFRRY
jgi:hypothetical protein